jgi:hypothetical protein
MRAVTQELARECPTPYFMRDADHTDVILTQARPASLALLLPHGCRF